MSVFSHLKAGVVSSDLVSPAIEKTENIVRARSPEQSEMRERRRFLRARASSRGRGPRWSRGYRGCLAAPHVLKTKALSSKGVKLFVRRALCECETQDHTVAARRGQAPNRGAKSRLALTLRAWGPDDRQPGQAQLLDLGELRERRSAFGFGLSPVLRHRSVHNSTLSSRPCHAIHHRQAVEWSRTSAQSTRDGGIPRDSNGSSLRNHRSKTSNRSFRLSKPLQPRRRRRSGPHSPPCSRPPTRRDPRTPTVYHSHCLMIRSLSELCPQWRVWAWLQAESLGTGGIGGGYGTRTM